MPVNHTLSYRWICLLMMGLAAVQPRGATVERLSLQRLSQEATLILRARCESRESVQDSRTGLIWTHYRFIPSQVLKGELPPELVVSEPGGSVNGASHVIAGIPSFVIGEEAVLFLYRTPFGKWRVRGLGQGHFRIEAEPQTSRLRVKENLGGVEFARTDQRESLPRGDFLEEFVEQVRGMVRAGDVRR